MQQVMSAHPESGWKKWSNPGVKHFPWHVFFSSPDDRIFYYNSKFWLTMNTLDLTGELEPSDNEIVH